MAVTAKGLLKCLIDECELLVAGSLGAAKTGGDMVTYGDGVYIVAYDVAASANATLVTYAPRVEFTVAADASAGTANFSAGNGIFWGSAGDGVLAGTGGCSTGVLIGTCLEAAAKTDGTVVGTFDSHLYQTLMNTKRA